MSGGGAKKAAPDTVTYRSFAFPLAIKSVETRRQSGEQCARRVKNKCESRRVLFQVRDACWHLLDAPPRQLHAEKSCKKRQVRAVITALDNKHRGENTNQTATDCYLPQIYLVVFQYSNFINS